MTSTFAEYAGRPSYTGADRIRPADLTSRWIPIEPKRPEHWGNHPDRHCIDSPHEFVPDKGGDFNGPKSVCQGCPVIDECLNEAMRDELHGIWGGTTTRDRERIRLGYATVEEARQIRPRGGPGPNLSDYCPNGHEYTPENTTYDKTHRRCVTCQRSRWRRPAATRKATRAARTAGAA